jgi:hypothetical protein
MKEIGEWWPLLHEQIRRVLANGIWMLVSEFARTEIERLGGPGANDPFWNKRDHEFYLPGSAVKWITEAPDFERFLEVQKPDPRGLRTSEGVGLAASRNRLQGLPSWMLVTSRSTARATTRRPNE